MTDPRTQAPFRIRPATSDDLDALVAIHLAARDTYYRGVVPDQQLDDPAAHAQFRDAYTHSIAAPERTVLCAQAGGAVVGFASLGPPFEPVTDTDPATVGQLVGLYVSPDHWGRGVGSALHEQCVHVWQATAITTGRLEVWEHNQRARDFYTRRGWRADGHRRPGPAESSFVRLCLAVPHPRADRQRSTRPGSANDPEVQGVRPRPTPSAASGPD
jgi:ribosomal protein S18 acetylase RimI-like enzyme